MKKTLLAVFVGAMMLATASIAMAEVTVGGSIEIRYDLWDDLNLNKQFSNYEDWGAPGSWNAGLKHGSTYQSFFADRVMLNVDAKITEGLEAFVELDTEDTENVWGKDHNGLAGHSANGNFDSLGRYLNHQNQYMNVRQAWINFMVPGLPVGVKIGHQPLALGHGIWLDTSRQGSDAILLYSKPMPELLVAAAYVKGYEGSPSYAGLSYRGGFQNASMDAWAVLANYTWMENNNAQVNFTYTHDTSPGTLVARDSGSNFEVPSAVWATNAMATLDGTIGPVTYKGEFDWLHININRLFQDNRKYTNDAFAAMLGASVKPIPMLTAGVELAYGTGNKMRDTNLFYDPTGGNNFLSSLKDHAYYTPYGNTSYNYAFLYNDKIGQGPFGTGGGYGFGDGFGGFGLANTGYVKVSVGVNPTANLSAGLDFLWLRASQKAVSGQSQNLGCELDANASYKIYSNLTLDVKGGVFIPGPWYKYGGDDGPAIVDNFGHHEALNDKSDETSGYKRDIAWGMETKLTVKF